jgi:hypothetical protein
LQGLSEGESGREEEDDEWSRCVLEEDWVKDERRMKVSNSSKEEVVARAGSVKSIGRERLSFRVWELLESRVRKQRWKVEVVRSEKGRDGVESIEDVKRKRAKEEAERRDRSFASVGVAGEVLSVENIPAMAVGYGEDVELEVLPGHAAGKEAREKIEREGLVGRRIAAEGRERIADAGANGLTIGEGSREPGLAEVEEDGT